MFSLSTLPLFLPQREAHLLSMPRSPVASKQSCQDSESPLTWEETTGHSSGSYMRNYSSCRKAYLYASFPPFPFNLSARIIFYHNASFDLKTALLKKDCSLPKVKIKIFRKYISYFFVCCGKRPKKSNSRKEGCTLAPVSHSGKGVAMGLEAAGHILSTDQKQREMLSYFFFIFI